MYGKQHTLVKALNYNSITAFLWRQGLLSAENIDITMSYITCKQKTEFIKMFTNWVSCVTQWNSACLLYIEVNP